MKFVTDSESSPLRYNQLCGRPYLRRLGVNKKMKRFFTLCLLVFFSFKFYANDYQLELDNRQYFGTVAKTTVNDDNLNIRLKPSTSSLKIGKLNKGDTVIIKGFSDKREKIDGFEGYWLKIQVEKNE